MIAKMIVEIEWVSPQKQMHYANLFYRRFYFYNNFDLVLVLKAL